MRAAAERRAFTPSRARQIELDDFSRFDLVLTMDSDNLRNVRSLAKEGNNATATIRPMLSYACSTELSDVPDPYYGGEQGFEHVLDLLEDARSGLIEEIKPQIKHQDVPSFCGHFEPEQILEGIDHRLNGHAIGDQFRGIGRLHKGCHIASAVEMVPLHDLRFQLHQGRNLKATTLEIDSPAASTLSGRGGEEHLEFSIGEHRRADVSTLGNKTATLTHALLLSSEQSSHTGMGSHHRHLGRHPGITNLVGDVVAVDPYGLHTIAKRIQLHLQPLQGGRHSCCIRRVKPLVQHPPGHCAIHRSRIEVKKPHALRKGAGHRCFPSTGRLSMATMGERVIRTV